VFEKFRGAWAASGSNQPIASILRWAKNNIVVSYCLEGRLNMMRANGRNISANNNQRTRGHVCHSATHAITNITFTLFYSCEAVGPKGLA